MLRDKTDEGKYKSHLLLLLSKTRKIIFLKQAGEKMKNAAKEAPDSVEKWLLINERLMGLQIGVGSC